MYDKNNVFARILRGEIQCEKVYEDAHTLAFEDINPKAPAHTLVIPKGEYVSATDFADNASDAEIAALMRAVRKVAALKGVDRSGYRLIANTGVEGGQEVSHFHFHVLGGRVLGAMVSR
jgi:diadenosine tetraphosphate (Ap4A) HIT family hydrolase